MGELRRSLKGGRNSHRTLSGLRSGLKATVILTAALTISEPPPSDRTHTIEAHFIRAPKLEQLPASSGRLPVQVVARHGDDGVFFTQGRIWACSFHVELGRDPTLHQLFCRL